MKNPAPNANFSKSLLALAIWSGLLVLLSACGNSQQSPAASPQPASQDEPTPQLTKIFPPTIQPSVTVKTAQTPTLTTAAPTLNPSTIVARTPLEEDNIREAILRYRFAATITNYVPTSQYFCLGLGNLLHSYSLQDLPPTFLARFQGNNPPVRKASDCVHNDDGTKVKATGETATIWAIDSIYWVNDSEVKLDISYSAAVMDAGGDIVQLKKENGSWKVTGSFGGWRT